MVNIKYADSSAWYNLYKEMGWQDPDLFADEVIHKVTSELVKFNCTCIYGYVRWSSSRPDSYEFATEEDYAHFCLVWS